MGVSIIHCDIYPS